MGFRKATGEDLDAILALIQQRIDWMDEKGLEQWNVTDYLRYYNRDYFAKNIPSIYVFDDNNCLLAVAAFYETDERWPDGKRAIYIHHLATRCGTSGKATSMLQFAEQVARERGIDRIRLDSDYGNIKLEQFYSSNGFTEFDSFWEGPYHGIRREKILSQ